MKKPHHKGMGQPLTGTNAGSLLSNPPQTAGGTPFNAGSMNPATAIKPVGGMMPPPPSPRGSGQPPNPTPAQMYHQHHLTQQLRYANSMMPSGAPGVRRTVSQLGLNQAEGQQPPVPSSQPHHMAMMQNPANPNPALAMGSARPPNPTPAQMYHQHHLAFQ